MISERSRLIKMGYAVIFYPALWGGNAHPENRAWCVYGSWDEDIVDYGSLRYLENSLQKQRRKYVILRTKRN
jgi:hypothetical protein